MNHPIFSNGVSRVTTVIHVVPLTQLSSILLITLPNLLWRQHFNTEQTGVDWRVHPFIQSHFLMTFPLIEPISKGRNERRIQHKSCQCITVRSFCSPVYVCPHGLKVSLVVASLVAMSQGRLSTGIIQSLNSSVGHEQIGKLILFVEEAIAISSVAHVVLILFCVVKHFPSSLHHGSFPQDRRQKEGEWERENSPGILLWKCSKVMFHLFLSPVYYYYQYLLLLLRVSVNVGQFKGSRVRRRSGDNICGG